MNSDDILGKHYFDIDYLYRYELPIMAWSEARSGHEVVCIIASGQAARWLGWETGRVLQGRLLSRDFPI